ncbi:hypothetical protein KZO01_26290 [Kurthia zopfii]|uniref:Uncharacterized protein DUF2247 n=1 Tax=Kurthia zopfii TaxID=1650 RepID=A0A8B4QAC1_9BACL|nr:DUF2247 family protein [Kurthia zopfii]PWI21117.1 hypothetical protein DF281_13840 [Kurthia zopfii]TDR32613.1 uncharacterized protein DUF2247 [Kurthia zopfii]GEK32320.1 hypothetical protein KZO01_26290 [Kurthia zopfii]STX09657.1 Uncharacterized protein conserved in bacteria [Kurthia zopfii]
MENMYGNEIYDVPKNELEINLPYTFIRKSDIDFSWSELYWGWMNRFISDETLIEIAEQEVVNDIFSEETLELASIMKSEIFVEQKKIKDLIEKIIDENLLRNKQFILNCKNKYLFAIASYLYQNSLSIECDQGYETILASIIEDFRAPSKSAEEFLFVLLEWVAYGIRADQELMEPWHVFLEQQHTCFFNEWNEK